jgi:hypothetical protein
MILGKHKQEFHNLKRLALTLACFVDDASMKLTLRSHFPYTEVQDVALFSMLQNCAAVERRSNVPVDPIMSRLHLGQRKDFLVSLLEDIIEEASKVNYPIGIYEVRRLDGFTKAFFERNFGDRYPRGQAQMRSQVIDAFFECFDQHKENKNKLWPFRPTDMPSLGIDQNFTAHIANLHGTALRAKDDPDYKEFEPILLYEAYTTEKDLADAIECIFREKYRSSYEPTQTENA